ncbi:PTS sugar transporter subunit IIB [Clostridium gasigenes]|uniref:PTS sugar transporter subunit IIB n=1 Tax=Clostridium gasigenes TaxID=94869 RepID=A0A1H0VT80_9CLOT|nr:PTS sugar transporter subunit IIB [Clostridium gasigenes]MBB6622518.1 PTS sugar transporter subunit IIB [Clostridium gasigenes]MBB6714165.1 PTS sugar transporter subunit IIB [Clostridium gasigenes]MBU3088498.1 PTS sugar transporter subunit IIB [Clostridium gasigenes]MBU3103906.1 PTS sugar transporter subunit IIB [Clostridium gasigenes]MBU3108145.1 PTS sugar transporter subunit IIB [Clostridium gasigenes]
MKRIVLVCSAGMSTSLLVSKMQVAAKDQGFECSIEAYGEAQLKNHEDEIDVLLLGPQVRFLFNKLKTKFDAKNVPVEVINMIDYGTMNGPKVLKQAQNLLNK